MTAAAAPGPVSDGRLWVFGYGSLMWRPGFAYARRCKAMLRGWRRSLCVFSHVYRGSPERPGLVLGLDRGGACAGEAFEVDAALRETTIRYLREREQATAVYLERIAPITLESGERVSALTYVADRLHRQYAGRLDREAMLTYVRAGKGESGDNAEYVLETYDHLRALGVRDRDLEWLSARLRARA
jgi:glutathione-specific gamma-glutamylcyclotransferase